MIEAASIMAKETPTAVHFCRGPLAGQEECSIELPEQPRRGLADRSEFSIDRNREYVTGLSFGGECTWMSLMERPDRFAAAVPICATDGYSGLAVAERAEHLAQLPLWIFHGDADEKVPVEASRKMVKALRDSGGNPKYTEYPGVNHNSWDQAYRDPELVAWLFAQKRTSNSH